MVLKAGSCVAAMARDGRVWMAADSLAVDSSGTRAEVMAPKVFRVGEAIVGVVGSIRVAQIIRRTLAEHRPDQTGEEFLDWLAETLAGEFESAGGVSDQTEWVALVGTEGRLFVLQSDFSWYEPVEGYWAEGAGADAAWAVLWLVSLGKLDLGPREAVELAVYAAMSRNVRVGGEVVTAAA